MSEETPCPIPDPEDLDSPQWPRSDPRTPEDLDWEPTCVEDEEEPTEE